MRISPFISLALSITATLPGFASSESEESTAPAPWYVDEFESEPVAVSGGRVSGELASTELRENSGWTQSLIEYTPLSEGAYSGEGFQRVEMKEGTRLEILKYKLPAQPGNFFQVEIALRGTPGASTNLVLSNTSDPVSGSPWMTYWERDVELTDEWVLHRFMLPDAKIPDELRFGINLSEPTVLDMDALKISVVDPKTAIAGIQEGNYSAPYAAQQVDGMAEEQPEDPWVGRYLLSPDDELTDADVVGPDGLVYPDWRYAGIPGGIPDVPVVVNASDHGAMPNDAIDDQEAIMAALDAAAAMGGGAVKLDEGFYLLSKPMVIVHDNVVLRGAGMDKTKLYFTYDIAPRSLTLVSHGPGEEVAYHEIIELHADPNDLVSIEMFLNGESVGMNKIGPHSIGAYWLKRPLFHIMHSNREIAAGPATLEAKAIWADGSEATLRTTLQLNSDAREAEGQIRFGGNNPAVITFSGDRWTNRGRRWNLARDLLRGDRVAEFEVAPPVEPGELIVITVPPHSDFTDRVGSARKDIPRRSIFIVEAVDGTTVTLNQPARIDYPVSQGARGSTVYPIRNSGIEDLTLEQQYKHWTHGIVIDRGYLCWMRGIKVEMAGRNPVGVGGSKQCEIRDAVFNDAWYLGGGGTGYVGFTSAFDCLMENIHTRRLRHAPNAQWAAQGNVFRNSVFEQSDAQFHMGWAVENLYENCVVDAALGSGSYGYGLFIQMPEVEIHGPGGGPRNVMYNNSFVSPNSGVFLGGSNEAWMILHNYFEVLGGAGMRFRGGVFDLIVQGNHIEVHSPVEPAFYIDGEAPGIQLLENRIVSRGGVLFDGTHAPAVWEGNEVITAPSATLDRPQPEIPSIFEWQRSL